MVQSFDWWRCIACKTIEIYRCIDVTFTLFFFFCWWNVFSSINFTRWTFIKYSWALCDFRLLMNYTDIRYVHIHQSSIRLLRSTSKFARLKIKVSKVKWYIRHIWKVHIQIHNESKLVKEVKFSKTARLCGKRSGSSTRSSIRQLTFALSEKFLQSLNENFHLAENNST